MDAKDKLEAAAADYGLAYDRLIVYPNPSDGINRMSNYRLACEKLQEAALAWWNKDDAV